MVKRLETLQKQRSRERKVHIYKIAMGLFEKFGYDNTTVRDICREAEVSTGSFYNFFGDKQEIIKLFCSNITQNTIGPLIPTETNLQKPYHSLYDYLMSVSSIFGNIGRDMSRHMMSLYNTLWRNPDGSYTEDASIFMIERFVKAAQEFGTIDTSIDAKEFAEYCNTVCVGVISIWLLDGGKYPIESLGSKTVCKMLKSYYPEFEIDG